MAIKLIVPGPLRNFTNQERYVLLEGATVGQALNNLVEKFPGLNDHIFEENMSIRRFINVFLNDEDIRFLQETATPITQTDTMELVPAISGG